MSGSADRAQTRGLVKNEVEEEDLVGKIVSLNEAGCKTNGRN